MLRLPPSEPPRLAEDEGGSWEDGPAPVPSKSAEHATSDLTGPLRINQNLPDQPKPNPEGVNLPSHRFGSYEVDPVPAGSFLAPPDPDPEPELQDYTAEELDELADPGEPYTEGWD